MTAPASDASGLWAALREAIRGSRRDYTEGPIGRALLLLAVPMIVEMVMESVFAVVDVFWVSRLGADAVATVGLTESMLAIIYTIAMGLSIGVSAMIARRIGEKDPEQASFTAVQGLALGVGFAILLGILGVTFAPRLLVIMGASPRVVALGSGYTTVMLGGNATILLLFLVNATFRGAGDAAIAMRGLWLANWINIILGPCFIFGLGPFPRLGVTGAAVATNIGRGTGVLFQFYNLYKGGAHLAVRRRHLRLDPDLMVRLLRLSGTGTFQVLVGTASWISLIRILATFGSDALAGYTIGIRLIIFALLPAWGLSNAAATMVGQGLGAKKPERAERAVWMAGWYNMLVLSFVGAVFAVFAHQIVGLFTHDPAVVPFGVSCLRLVSLGFPFYAYGMVLTQSFNGAGDTWTPTWLNFLVFWLWEIPLAYILSRTLGWGPKGVFIALTIAFSTLAVASGALFRRGKWKLRKV